LDRRTPSITALALTVEGVPYHRRLKGQFSSPLQAGVRVWAQQSLNVRFGSLADISQRIKDVRFTLEN
jgi:hypothetical protein